MFWFQPKLFYSSSTLTINLPNFLQTSAESFPTSVQYSVLVGNIMRPDTYNRPNQIFVLCGIKKHSISSVCILYSHQTTFQLIQKNFSNCLCLQIHLNYYPQHGDKIKYWKIMVLYLYVNVKAPSGPDSSSYLQQKPDFPRILLHFSCIGAGSKVFTYVNSDCSAYLMLN
jgi:hypothetical protein